MPQQLPRTLDQLHWMLIRRLSAAAIAMGALAAGSAYLVGGYRAGQMAKESAAIAASHFERPGMALLSADRPEQREHIKQILDANHFVAIRLFDATGAPVYEIWKDRALDDNISRSLSLHAHQWPAVGNSHKNWISVDGENLIQVVLPLGEVKTLGYLEGVYRISREMSQQQQRQIRDVVLATVASVIATVCLLYPLLLTMLRGSEGLSRRLLDSNLALIRSLGNAAAKRDSDTDAHSYRVTLYAVALAEALDIPQSEIADLVAGAFLHDIGKIGIPDQILLKPGKLSEAEFEIMKTHAMLGHDIVAENVWMEGAAVVIRHHHERFDGNGYPDGLRGGEIPRNARLFAVVDVFDALTSVRPYKQSMPLAEALTTLLKDAGTHFDTQAVTAFVTIASKLHGRLAQASEAQLHNELRQVLVRYFKSETNLGRASS